jgi:hypothetical protein
MNTLALFLFQIAICLSISLAVNYLLKGLLTDVLTETCGTEKRAAFWAMFTQLMLYLAPLLIVVYFAPADPVTDKTLVHALKDTLFYSLFGLLAGLAVVGKIILKSIDTLFTSDQANLDINLE